MNLRAYFFGNMYLSSIQQGIQAAHVVAEMFVKYHGIHPMLLDWATIHKTMILLNGGYSNELHRLHGVFASNENPFPYAAFYESEAALDGAITSLGIILPEYIWIGARQVREDPITMPGILARKGFVDYQTDFGENVEYSVTRWEIDNLICQLSNYGLAK